MPSYFFHLVFELYPPESEILKQVSPVQLGFNSEVQRDKFLHQLPCLKPKNGFDIFQDKENELVDHGEGLVWESESESISSNNPASDGKKPDVLIQEKQKTKQQENGLEEFQETRHIDSRFGRITVKSIDIAEASFVKELDSVGESRNKNKEDLGMSYPPRAPPVLAAAVNTATTVQRRGLSMSVQVAQSTTSQRSKQNPTTNSLLEFPERREKDTSPSTTSGNSDSSKTFQTQQRQQQKRSQIGAMSGPPRARFIPLPSKNTEFGFGVVHLYRDREETPELYPIAEVPETYSSSSGSFDMSASRCSTSSSSKQISRDGKQNEDEIDEESLTTVAILAVPTYMTASDFMGFVGEETRENVKHIRMIRAGKANRYMVLMRFRTREGARAFVKSFNGKLFNSMEPENCHVVFVKSIQFSSHSSVSTSECIDPFSPSFPTTTQPSSHSPLSTKPAPPPTPSLLELPTCPVCLERMDETTGLLTILCQHVFHCACLSKWRDSSCPVCRYTQGGIPPFLRDGSTKLQIPGVEQENEEGHEEQCIVCGVQYNLWICLICGHIGCGRYDDAHAFQHFKDTGHSYAMDVDTQRVWDYAGDGYVHRLIQNKTDGKLVELPSALSNSDNSDKEDYVPKEKLDNIGMEYTFLLTSQLESQRMYYERQIAAAADKAHHATVESEKLTTENMKLKKDLESLKIKFEELITSTVPSLEKAKIKAEQGIEKYKALSKKMEKEWKEEKAVSSSLMEKIEYLSKLDEERKKDVEEAKKEIGDLKEQVRDLMFFLEARDKVKEMVEGAAEENGKDFVEGNVVVPPPAGGAGGSKKKGKGRKK